jgi:excisionase family DNA binding protein
MNDSDLAASFAIFAAKQSAKDEVTPDHILLGCLRAISRFGIAMVGPWSLDLEVLGVDWVRVIDGPQPRVAYSQRAVALFDRAARIAKSSGSSGVGVSHLLAAFATEEDGLMGQLKKAHKISSASWRKAIAAMDTTASNGMRQDAVASGKATEREYLTPEEAAEILGVHVQTMRAYIRAARLPAFRLAGDRAIRLRRADLEKVLEPLEVGKKEE